MDAKTPGVVRKGGGLYLVVLLVAALTVGLPLKPVAAQPPEPRSPYAPVSAALAEKLAESTGAVSFLVVLDEQVDTQAVLAAPAAGEFGALARRAALYAALTETARRTQAPLRAWLDAQGVDYHTFYLANMIEVKGDAALAEALRRRTDVARLELNPRVAQQFGVEAPRWQTLAAAPATAALPYGLQFTNADNVWAQGFRGAGIVVASQDTGVMWDHAAIKQAYRGWDSTAMTVTHPFNWLDAWGRTAADAECPSDPQLPCDDAIDGFPPTHGSHTTGTMVGDATAMGDTILGMAPDAKWIGCRNMQDGFGTPASYTTCFEFFFAPYPQDGDPQADGDVTKSPHVINNSWGCPPSEGCDVDTLRQVVENVRAGGIFVAASAGNEGWGGACSTIANPIGLYDASFTVGAHDSSGSIADFSSRGPVTADGSNRLKPDISAPGVSVRSIGPADGLDNWMSGTSMASPHVAGAVALLWSAAPALSGEIDLTEQILLRSARPAPSAECESSGGSPNNVYGYGWLDVAAAIKLATTPVTLTVRLRDASNAPLTGVAVKIMDKYTKFHYPVQVTNSAGVAQWNPARSGGLLFAGDYEVSAGCAGFTDEKSVSVKASRTVTVTVAPANARSCIGFPQILR